MDINYNISIYLDKRRKKDNGKYPVKLTVYMRDTRKQKFYPTIFDFTEKEFNRIWKSKKVTENNRPYRKKLDALIKKAEDIAEKIKPFNFEDFEKRIIRRNYDGMMVNYHYEDVIQELNKRGQVGNSSNYELSRKSLKTFAEQVKKQEFNKLRFSDITANWLFDYEKYMTIDKERSHTTVSIYLRALRAIFNKAIEEREFSKETYYPFGKKRYVIPRTKNVKKALTLEQLNKLFSLTPLNKAQEKAKDFWFLSYACNGMNIKDIATLQYKSLKQDHFTFYRAKTLQTSKSNMKIIKIYLNDFIRSMIKKYGNDETDSNSYIFNILNKDQTPQQQQAKIKNFTRMINQNLQNLCKANDLPDTISTYWARHTWATNAIRKGASMEFVQEGLGHGDLKTTQNYFAGFDDDSKKEFADNVMHFDE